VHVTEDTTEPVVPSERVGEFPLPQGLIHLVVDVNVELHAELHEVVPHGVDVAEQRGNLGFERLDAFLLAAHHCAPPWSARN
jgi:hypothetical protein